MKRGSTGQHYNNRHIKDINTVTIGSLNTEIENLQEQLIAACNAFVETSVDLLNKKAKSFIDQYYSSYEPMSVSNGGHIRRSRLYKSLHPQNQNNLTSAEKADLTTGIAPSKGYTMYGGLRVDSSSMKDYDNLQMKYPPFTSASDVLRQTLLNEGNNGYHGQHGSHPGKQRGAQSPIKTGGFDFVRDLKNYFNSDGFVKTAYDAAQSQLNSIT